MSSLSVIIATPAARRQPGDDALSYPAEPSPDFYQDNWRAAKN
jgi:hypothetical protein